MSCRDETSKHYSLLYTASVSNPPEVQSRLAALEEHMRVLLLVRAQGPGSADAEGEAGGRHDRPARRLLARTAIRR